MRGAADGRQLDLGTAVVVVIVVVAGGEGLVSDRGRAVAAEEAADEGRDGFAGLDAAVALVDTAVQRLEASTAMPVVGKGTTSPGSHTSSSPSQMAIKAENRKKALRTFGAA